MLTTELVCVVMSTLVAVGVGNSNSLIINGLDNIAVISVPTKAIIATIIAGSLFVSLDNLLVCFFVAILKPNILFLERAGCQYELARWARLYVQPLARSTSKFE